MFADFLPSFVNQLRNSTCIAVVQSIKRHSIATPYCKQPVATSYIQQGTGGTPILLLHGFDSSLLEFFVKQLVLINSIGYSGSFQIGQFLFPPIDFMAIEWLRFLKLQTLANAKADRSRDAAYLDALLCAIMPLEMPGWYESVLTFTKTGGYSLSEEQISQIDKPTLILWGELDAFLSKGDEEKFNRAIANSILHNIQGCGHAPQFEQPEVIAKHILAFRQTDESSHV